MLRYSRMFYVKEPCLCDYTEFLWEFLATPTKRKGREEDSDWFKDTVRWSSVNDCEREKKNVMIIHANRRWKGKEKYAATSKVNEVNITRSFYEGLNLEFEDRRADLFMRVRLWSLPGSDKDGVCLWFQK